MERYLADTWLQKLCNRQYRSVDWLRLLVKLNSPEAEPDAIRIIQQMEVEDAMAASPIEQFRSGLLAEVRLLGLLIPDKPAAQVPVQATGDGP
jgi:hypothetical protein